LSYSPERAQEFSRRQPQLSDSVASYIRDLIMSGEVRSGEFLRVDRISKDMGVSMTPVREALAALRREGFVDQEPRRGFVVAPLTARDVRDLFNQQADIAAELAARAVEALDQSQVSQLSDLQDALEDAAARGMVDDVERLNFEFHRIINTSSGSAKLEWILSMLVRYAPRRFFANIPGWWEASVLEHRQIISALRRRDAEQVRAAVRSHIVHAGTLLVEHLEEKESLDLTN
jgi:DNA-binding GntR family transcriptional regulator